MLNHRQIRAWEGLTPEATLDFTNGLGMVSDALRHAHPLLQPLLTLDIGSNLDDPSASMLSIVSHLEFPRSTAFLQPTSSYTFFPYQMIINISRRFTPHQYAKQLWGTLALFTLPVEEHYIMETLEPIVGTYAADSAFQNADRLPLVTLGIIPFVFKEEKSAYQRYVAPSTANMQLMFSQTYAWHMARIGRSVSLYGVPDKESHFPLLPQDVTFYQFSAPHALRASQLFEGSEELVLALKDMLSPYSSGRTYSLEQLLSLQYLVTTTYMSSHLFDLISKVAQVADYYLEQNELIDRVLNRVTTRESAPLVLNPINSPTYNVYQARQVLVKTVNELQIARKDRIPEYIALMKNMLGPARPYLDRSLFTAE